VVALLGSTASVAQAAAFTEGNLAVYRVGVPDDLSNPISGGEPVFIDEYTTAGALVQSIALPTDTIGNQRRLVAHGTSTAEGFVNRSPNGQWLTFAGYDAALGTAGLNNSTASTVNRVVARIDAAGNVDTSTALDNWTSGNSPRSVITTDGTRLLMAGGGGGIREANLGDTTSIAFTTQIGTLRHIDIFFDRLYASTGTAAAPASVAEINQTTGAPEYLTGVTVGSGATGFDVYQFFVADLSTTVEGPDTLYVADDRSQGNGGGLHKFSLVDGTWVDNGGVFGVQTPGVSSLRGLTGVVSGTDVTLYATRNGNALLSFSDSTGHNGTMSGAATLLASAPANTLFKGLDFAPVAGTAGLPGDFNDDTLVDAADLADWRNDFAGGGGSDADGDGDSDGRDFLIWQRGVSTGGAAPTVTSVPEPSAALLLGLGGLALAGRGRRLVMGA
jgi:hypothetical protein